MPMKTYLIEGEYDEEGEPTTIQQVFSTPSKAISYRNRGQNPAQMHLVSTSPSYNEETITVEASMNAHITLPIITDRVKFTFTDKTQIELIEEY